MAHNGVLYALCRLFNTLFSSISTRERLPKISPEAMTEADGITDPVEVDVLTGEDDQLLHRYLVSFADLQYNLLDEDPERLWGRWADLDADDPRLFGK